MMWKIVLSHTWFRFATSINIGINWDVKPESVRLNCYHYSQREVIQYYYGTLESRKWEHNPLSIIISITFNNMRRRSWISTRRRRMMWKIVLSHAWFKCQCILMIPSLSFCNKHQYWNWLRHEDWIHIIILIGRSSSNILGHLNHRNENTITFNHDISLSHTMIWGEEEVEHKEVEEGEELCER